MAIRLRKKKTVSERHVFLTAQQNDKTANHASNSSNTKGIYSLN